MNLPVPFTFWDIILVVWAAGEEEEFEVRVALLLLLFAEEAVPFIIPPCPDLPGISGLAAVEVIPTFDPPPPPCELWTAPVADAEVRDGDMDGDVVLLQFLEQFSPVEEGFETSACWVCWSNSGVIVSVKI